MNRNQELIELAKKNIAGGTNSMMRLLPYSLPIVISKADGAFVWDANNAKLIDLNMGYGPLIFGHRAPVVIDSIKKELDIRGSVLGFVHELSSEAACLIKKSFKSIDLLRFSSTGTEVIQTAVRLARTFTKRRKLIVFEGHYHGSSNAVFHKYHSDVDELESAGFEHACAGTQGMGDYLADVIRLPWNDMAILDETFKKHGEAIAAVIMEPVMGNAAVIPPKPGYLKEVRDITTKYGALLIFDEIITGFRVSRGGAQERYDVQSDITALSKAMNGGVPISAIGGRKEIMDLLTSGEVFHGGVYSGNPMCVAATLAVQREFDVRSDCIFNQLEDISAYLKNGFVDIFSRRGIPIVFQNVGSMLSMTFTKTDDVTPFENYRQIKANADMDRYIKFQHMLQEKGVYIHPNLFEPWYLCTVHTKNILDNVLSTVEKVAASM